MEDLALGAHDAHTAAFACQLAELAYPSRRSKFGGLGGWLISRGCGFLTRIDEENGSAYFADFGSFRVVSFAGTDELADWLNNVDIWKTEKGPFYDGDGDRVHRGFAQHLDPLWAEIRDVVINKKPSGVPLLLTGHSLGGALATLAAGRFSYADPEIPITLYTFGSPRAGNRHFSRALDRRLAGHFRYTHEFDPVPWLPFVFGWYRHGGRHYHFDRGLDLRIDPPVLKLIEAGLFPMVRALVLGVGGGLANSIADHSVGSYKIRCLSEIKDPKL